MSEQSHYARAGVNIDAGQRAVDLMKQAVRETYTPQVLSDTGNFGGLFDISAFLTMQAPVLVASTDGVGTKTKVAAKLNQWDTIGQDLVNHCINDILVQGAKPLFFMDYIASSRLEPEQIAAIVSGMAKACKEAGCALLGGETAEMPGVYVEGEVDVAGTIVGIVDRQALIDGKSIEEGDSIIALPSSGLHTNGFSLARAVLQDLDWSAFDSALGMSPGEALLAVHRCYLHPIEQIRSANIPIRGLAHITGGGVIDNLPRILPENLGAVIRRGTWAEPAIFSKIQTLGEIDETEMFRVFNMGLGMLVVVAPIHAQDVLRLLPETSLVGEIINDAEQKVTITQGNA